MSEFEQRKYLGLLGNLLVCIINTNKLGYIVNVYEGKSIHRLLYERSRTDNTYSLVNRRGLACLACLQEISLVLARSRSRNQIYYCTPPSGGTIYLSIFEIYFIKFIQ